MGNGVHYWLYHRTVLISVIVKRIIATIKKQVMHKNIATIAINNIHHIHPPPHPPHHDHNYHVTDSDK